MFCKFLHSNQNLTSDFEKRLAYFFLFFKGKIQVILCWRNRIEVIGVIPTDNLTQKVSVFECWHTAQFNYSADISLYILFSSHWKVKQRTCFSVYRGYTDILLNPRRCRSKNLLKCWRWEDAVVLWVWSQRSGGRVIFCATSKNTKSTGQACGRTLSSSRQLLGKEGSRNILTAKSWNVLVTFLFL